MKLPNFRDVDGCAEPFVTARRVLPSSSPLGPGEIPAAGTGKSRPPKSRDFGGLASARRGWSWIGGLFYISYFFGSYTSNRRMLVPLAPARAVIKIGLITEAAASASGFDAHRTTIP